MSKGEFLGSPIGFWIAAILSVGIFLIIYYS